MNDIDTLIKLWEEGLSATEIGNRIGKSKGSVVGKIYRLREKGYVFKNRTSKPPIKKTAEKVISKKKILLQKQMFEQYKLPFFEENWATQAANDVVVGDKVVEPEFFSPEASGGLKLLFDLAYDNCRYVAGRCEQGALYCSKPSHKRQMCKAHYDLCYVVVPKSAEKKKTFVFKNF